MEPSNKIQNIHQSFIQKARDVHNNKYDYSLIDSSNYINIRSKLPIICKIHGVFLQRGDDHNRGHGCKKCGRISCSQKALTWLDHIMQTEQIHIQHAGNGGEFRIPTTCMSADGYCVETNTIYEFDGDAFHGNLNRYDPTDHCHPFDKSKTAQQLYEDTISKHQRVQQLGYNLITIWESDFDLLNISLVSNYNDIVISKLDNTYPTQLNMMGLQIIGEYVGAKIKHQLLCLSCGGIHQSTPVSKIWSKKRHPDIYGCPKCNKKITDAKNKTRGNYVQRLEQLNYTVVGYKNAGIRCTLICNICKKEKYVVPSAIIQNGKPCCGSA